MTFDITGRRIVSESALLAEYRRKLSADPVHEQRIRSVAHDTPPEELLDLLSVPPKKM
ncbi:hypothetical protein [Leucobacter luti]|nr:hypothetical protein [Leucobacter luti]